MLLHGGTDVGQVWGAHRWRRRRRKLIVQLLRHGRRKRRLELPIHRCLLGHRRWQLNHMTAKLLRSLQRSCTARCCKGLIRPIPIYHKLLLHARLLLLLLLHRHHHGCSICGKGFRSTVPHKRRRWRHHGTDARCHGTACKTCHCMVHAVRRLIHPIPLRGRAAEQWGGMHGGPRRKAHD